MSVAGPPLLYSFRRCPYAMRARWAFLICEQSCELREVALSHKPAHLIELSPKATVPVLQLPDDTVLDESLDIMGWALTRQDPEKWLLPEAEDLSAMQNLITTNDQEFKFHLDRYKYANRYDEVDPMLHRAEAETFIQGLEARLQSQAYLFGSRRALADIAIMPFVRQFSNADRAWFDAAPYPSVQNWLKTLLAGEDFARVMTHYEIYQPGQEPVLFPPA